MKKITLGLAMCGSFCTFSRVLDAFEALDREIYDFVPIMSQISFETDSRFGPAAQFRERLEALCGREIVHTIKEAEPFGPKKLLDALVIMPCTGNTLAKLAAGIADGPVTLAAKAHLRNERPVIVAVSTNDGLAGNAANLGALLNRRGYYFVPFGQDSALARRGLHKAAADRRDRAARRAAAADAVRNARRIGGRQAEFAAGESPPSGSSKLPPPLTMQGMARGGFDLLNCAYFSAFSGGICASMASLIKRFMLFPCEAAYSAIRFRLPFGTTTLMKSYAFLLYLAVASFCASEYAMLSPHAYTTVSMRRNV